MPVIFLTGMGEHEVDVAAMKAGAADYLIKGQLEPAQLERSIRYAIERKRAAVQSAFDQALLAAFGAEVGLILTRKDTLEAMLDACAQAMNRYLNGVLAEIQVYDPERARLVPGGAAGQTPETTEPMPETLLVRESQLIRLRTEVLAQGKPILIPNVSADPRIPDKARMAREQFQSYAAHPVLLEGRLVGLMSLFSKGHLTEVTVQEMASVVHGIALCIERKRSERALNVSEGRYRSVVESISEVIFQMTPSGRLQFLSPAWTTLTHHQVSETIKSPFLDFIHADDREECRRVLLEASEPGADFLRYEVRLLTKKGKVRWVELHAKPTRNADGMVIGLSGSLSDITDRKQAEVQIQKLAAFPRVNPNPVLEFSANGSLTYSNNAACQLQYTLGVHAVEALLPTNYKQIVLKCLASRENHLREETVCSGRTIVWSFFPVNTSRVVHCYGNDVTDMVSLEEQFRHSQKLESVARLAAGVAHDFNNVLTVIQGYSECLLMQCKDNPQTISQLKAIHGAAARASGLTRQLLTFSRKQVLQTKIFNVGSMIENLKSILSPLLGEDIALQTDFEKECASVLGDVGMIEQVVMNLAVNARDAMPGGGRLLIGLNTVEVNADHVKHHVDAREGRFVCISVTDTGCGMDPATISRIFEPFYSTKEVGKGTGLGLATVHGIVKQHQGWIEVCSELGSGTTFQIFLPAADAKPLDSTADLDSLSESSQGAEEVILLVEDEPELRQLVRKVLCMQNYRVVDASDGVEALKLWDQHEGRIDLLLTDIVMPRGINGVELAARLRSRKPDLKVIFTSGYSDAIAEMDQHDREEAFVAKPYRPTLLAQLVRERLDINCKSRLVEAI
jgi:PAS domain S-box-containing protein